jgi:hypothetical protein
MDSIEGSPVERCLACEADGVGTWSAASLARPMRSAPWSAASLARPMVSKGQPFVTPAPVLRSIVAPSRFKEPREKLVYWFAVGHSQPKKMEAVSCPLITTSPPVERCLACEADGEQRSTFRDARASAALYSSLFSI